MTIYDIIFLYSRRNGDWHKFKTIVRSQMAIVKLISHEINNL